MLSIRSMRLKPKSWTASCVHTEATLHQLSPYIGKLKSAIAQALIRTYTNPGDTIFDPFSGSGTIPLEAAVSGRHVIASDASEYAVTLTEAKLRAPSSLEDASERLRKCVARVQRSRTRPDLRRVPTWVRTFFHPETLKEAILYRDQFVAAQEPFLLACLLGILHHQRPGFLSYPASHLVPYLRTNKYPRSIYPEMYEFRPVAQRLLAKVQRAYRRPATIPHEIKTTCLHSQLEDLGLKTAIVDAIITSPPYMNALDYYRDNRLRLWFLEAKEVTEPNRKTKVTNFRDLMSSFAKIASKTIKSKGACILVVGEVHQRGRRVDTAKVVDAAMLGSGSFSRVDRYRDSIPDIRRSRRMCRSTKNESILVYQRL